MPNIINELVAWLQLQDTPVSYATYAGASPEVLPSEMGMGFAFKANINGDPAVLFRVADGISPEDAVNVNQLNSVISGMQYQGAWTPNATSFPNELLVPANIGFFWICDADGTDKDGRTWETGDWCIYNGDSSPALGQAWDQVAVRPKAGLPPSSITDAGKALVVDASGVAAWGAMIEHVDQFINGGQF